MTRRAAGPSPSFHGRRGFSLTCSSRAMAAWAIFGSASTSRPADRAGQVHRVVRAQQAVVITFKFVGDNACDGVVQKSQSAGHEPMLP